MIIITFFGEDIISGFEVRGHAGFGEEGQDIICAAVSSAVYMTVNTVTDIYMIDPVLLEVEDGRLCMKLEEKDAEKCRDLILGFKLHVSEFARDLREKGEGERIKLIENKE